jgi:hypothetical protein
METFLYFFLRGLFVFYNFAQHFRKQKTNKYKKQK